MPGGLEVSCDVVLRTPRRRLAGGEQFSRRLQIPLKRRGERVRATEHASRGRYQFLERLNALAQIVERGGGVMVERMCVKHPHPEREITILSENTPRHGDPFAQQRLGFFEAL